MIALTSSCEPPLFSCIESLNRHVMSTTGNSAFPFKRHPEYSLLFGSASSMLIIKRLLAYGYFMKARGTAVRAPSLM